MTFTLQQAITYLQTHAPGYEGYNAYLYNQARAVVTASIQASQSQPSVPPPGATPGYVSNPTINQPSGPPPVSIGNLPVPVAIAAFSQSTIPTFIPAGTPPATPGYQPPSPPPPPAAVEQLAQISSSSTTPGFAPGAPTASSLLPPPGFDVHDAPPPSVELEPPPMSGLFEGKNALVLLAAAAIAAVIYLRR